MERTKIEQLLENYSFWRHLSEEEKKMLQDFGMSEFVVCTDAGLSSHKNKRYNAMQGRSYITTQSLKKLNADLQQTALAPDGWYLMGAKA